jgi:hypothetical protein
MQISRHWRLNSQRYRLEGVRYVNGEVRLQARPVPCGDVRDEKPTQVQAQQRVTVSAGK